MMGDESGEPIWLHDMLLERADGGPVELEALKQRLEACFLTVMRASAENDGYNALVLAAGVPWRDVALVRAISRFLRQVRIAYSQDYLWATLRKHARSEEHTSELQSPVHLVCRLLLEKKNQ